MKRFHEKVALVTGATSGIGRATALAFAAEGAHVALAGRRLDRLAETSARASACGVRVLELAGDVRDAAVHAAWARQVGEQFGRLDYLVHAAGVLGNGSIESTPALEWDRIMDSNIRSILLLTQPLLPLLRKGTDAAITCVSSVAGHRPYAGLVAYCVSKAAVDMYVRCAALDLAPEKIRVNAVNPGVVRTELHTVTQAVADYAGFLERGKSTHPIGRVGAPEEIAAAILYLSSPEAGWITGTTLAIDGGRGLASAR